MTNPIKHLLDKIAGGTGFTKAVATLLSGTVIALVISYLAQPILTRIYTPEAFGLFDTFVSIVTLLVPFASLRYEDAIMLPEDDEKALGVLGLTFALVIIVAGLSLGLTIFDTPFTSWFNSSHLSQSLIWIPPTLIAVRFARLTELWLTRKKQYAIVSRGQVLQTGLMAASRIAFSKITSVHLPFGLLWGYIIGHLASALLYASKILNTQPAFWRSFTGRENILQAARRYKQFPGFSMPSTLLTSLQSRLPFILLLYFFDQATVGYFGRAFALFAVPLSLTGNAISQVFFVEGAIARREESLAHLTEKVHSRLVTIGLFPTLAVIITGPQVMRFFLGPDWGPAGEYLQWLAPWFFLASIASPLTRVFDILEKQRIDFLTSISTFTIQTAFFIYGCLTGDLTLTLIYLSLGGFLARTLHIIVLLKLAGASLTASLYPYLQQTLVSIPLLVILYFVQGFQMPWLTTASLVLTGTGFLFIIYRQFMR